jgi:hypothetical protein
LERRSSSLLRLSFIVLAAVTAGCDQHPKPPVALLDGSPARQPAVKLAGLESPTVLTKAAATKAGDVGAGSAEASCLARQANDSKPVGDVVARVGVWGASVTFRERSAIVGCDTSRSSSGGGGRRWCGGSYGRLFGGRLRDPRLDIAGCRTGGGEPVGFVWIEPRRDSKYVVVAQPGYAEVYPVVRGLPVRVATVSGIDSDPIGAAFDVSEHDAAGHLRRTYRLTARPSG